MSDVLCNKWVSDVSSTSSGTARPAASNPAGRAPHTGMTPASGAAADLRHPTTSRVSDTYVLRFPNSASRPPSLPSQRKTAGTLAREVFDGLVTIAGLLVFACVAMFFLVLA